jgi:hypothetical protein
MCSKEKQQCLQSRQGLQGFGDISITQRNMLLVGGLSAAMSVHLNYLDPSSVDQLIQH